MKTEAKAAGKAEASQPVPPESCTHPGAQKGWSWSLGTRDRKPAEDGKEAEVGHVNAQSLFFFSSHLKANCNFLRST